MFEEFLQHITVHQAVSQQLLFPVVIDITKEELAFLNDIKSVLEHTGFVFSKLENETIEISGIPAAIKNEQVRFIISDLLACIDENAIDDASQHCLGRRHFIATHHFVVGFQGKVQTTKLPPSNFFVIRQFC